MAMNPAFAEMIAAKKKKSSPGGDPKSAAIARRLGKKGKEGSPQEERTESKSEAKKEGDNPFAKKG